MLFSLELSPLDGDGDGTLAPYAPLLELAPDLVFVAEPPGVDSDALIAGLARRAGTALVPHLTTRNRAAEDIAVRVGAWRGLGIERVLALRGDQATACDLSRDQRLRSGRELAQLLLALDPELEVWCAAYPEVHPEAASADADLRALAAKAAVGCAAALCQFTFEADAYLAFRDRVRDAGIALPLLAGILPIHAEPALLPFARACGARLPAAVTDAVERYAGDAAALEQWGVAQAVALAERYRREEVDGVQVFTWNRPAAARAIAAALGPR